MKYKMLVGMLVICLVLTGTTTVHGQTLAPPAWVPEKVTGWTLAYNNYTQLGFDFGGSNVVSNWTQIWIKNTSTTVEAAVGVVNFEYDEDYFSKAVPNTVKLFVSLAGAGGYGLPVFNGNTMWDLFKWMAEATGVYGTTVTDETGNVAGATGAFSLNITVGESNFYLLFAYRGKFAMMIFAISVEQTIDDWVLAGDWASLRTLFNDFASLLVTAFGTVMSILVWIATFDPSLGAAPATADVTPTGGIEPTASNPSTPQDVNTFADSYVPLLPGGIPGYPVLLVGIVSFFAVLVIVQKKRKAIVA